MARPPVLRGVPKRVPPAEMLRAEASVRRGRPICLWSPYPRPSEGAWGTSCGRIHVFFSGTETPEGQGMLFCCYCGKSLEEGTRKLSRLGNKR